MGTIPFFDAIGWGQWFRYVSGAMDTAGALADLHPALDLPGSFDHQLHCGPWHRSLLHKGPLQSNIPSGHDPSRCNPGMACLETETSLKGRLHLGFTILHPSAFGER
jgi:hypothetical protein